ncbi:hypothetical protein [Pseudonocardia sp.]|jgi:hypothetical protein|uniref:hypothetical protein n=1 Tax=Pseudonocardia sp. TaxID=60912 RepID=UPI0031FC898D
MADDEQRDRTGPENPVTAFAQQLRDAADRMMTGWPGMPGLPGMPKPSAAAVPGAASAMPLPPATASAHQLQSVLADLGARRAQVQALCTQLSAFDEQLAALEASLRPLHDWAKTWADVEGAAASMWRPPERP